jgi:SPP1 family predicted phage head-tail adaptor
MNEILTLIRTVTGVDDYGDPAIAETRRDVFCRLASIGQKEFYQAQAVGLQPEMKFVLADYWDYDGELLVEYNGTRYRVLRTYRTGQEIELVVYREVNPA